MVELEGTQTEVGNPEVREDAAPVAFADVDPHGRGHRVRTGSAPLPGRRIAAEHGEGRIEERVVGLRGGQAAADPATRVSGSPMTRFAGPWSQPYRRRASRKAATVSRSTVTGYSRAPSGRTWRIPKRVA